MEETKKPEESNKKTKKKMSNKTRSICIAAILGTIIVAGTVALVIVLVNRNNEPELEDIIVNGQSLSEEEKRVTKETIQEFIDMEVKGYQHIDTDNGGYNAVVIEVKNHGDKRTSLAIDVVARNKADNTVLDTSSMYAEGIEPGQTYTFHTFVYSKVPAEQLKEAKFDIYKANTYEAGTTSEPTEEPEMPAEEPTEEPTEEPEIEPETAEPSEESEPQDEEAPAEEQNNGENQEQQ